jgi:hypothetical protein
MAAFGVPGFCTEVARSERFELPTLGIEIRCSIQLSYERIDLCDTERVGFGPDHRRCHAEVFAFSSELFNTPRAPNPSGRNAVLTVGRAYGLVN